MSSRAIPWLVLLALLPGAAAADGAPSDEELRNLAYRGIEEQPVALRDGRWEGRPYVPDGASRPRVELARSGIARGDLDGDGRDEAAVLLIESSGGTGLNHYVAVVAARDGELRNVATTRLGDRIQIIRFAVDAGRVVVEAVVAGPDDPMCCPTRKTRRTLALNGSELEVEEEQLGSVELADLARNGWRLTRLDFAETPGSDAPITLALRDGQLAGSAGCNRYFSEVESEGGQQLSLGPVGATRRSCPPEVMADEAAFLARFEQVDRFSFVMGELALAYRGDGRMGTLFFEASDTNE